MTYDEWSLKDLRNRCFELSIEFSEYTPRSVLIWRIRSKEGTADFWYPANS